MEDPDDELEDPDDSLELGIRAAFAGDTNSVRRSGIVDRKSPESRVTLREAGDDPTPIVLRGRTDGSHPEAIKRYDIAGEMARGGVGSVLKARDRDLGRDVAVKVLLERHRDNPEMIRRFLEEAQIAGQLQHPGVVPVHEIGVLDDDRPYFAMKLVKGQTLAEILESRTSPDEGRTRLLGIFEQVAQTLAYAHTRGVIHRDLKPSNIMVGAFGEVQVMDWGLAKVLAKGGAADDARTTRPIAPDDVVRTARSGDSDSDSIAGSVMGTPAYMPPEQARGAVDELDERSDVFGLGAILCEILTGRPPYSGESVDEIYCAAREAKLDGALGRIRSSGVEPELIDIALDCLQADARQRPRNAQLVSKRLSAHFESVERRAEEHRDRAASFKVKMSLAVLALAAVVLGGGALFVFDRVRDHARETMLASVGERLGRARVLREQAKGARDLSLWHAALRECTEAVSLAGGDAPEEALELRSELEIQVRDQRTVADLERLREERDSDSEELEYRFRSVFLNYGIHPEEDGIDEAARKVSESAIRQQLVLALDQWAVTDRFGRGRRTRLLLDIAQRADDDPWRQRLREAVRVGHGHHRRRGRGDEDAQSEERIRLTQLVEEAESRLLAPSTLEVLAFALGGIRERELERRVWRRAQTLHPDDFWINVRLGDFYRWDKEYDLALQYLRAAFAVRPESAYAAYKLGTVLCDAGSYSEGLALLGRAIITDDERRYLDRAAKIVRENGERIPLDDLQRISEIVTRVETSSESRSVLEAELLFATGRVVDAVLLLERELPPRRERSRGGRRRPEDLSPHQALDRLRTRALPDLVSFATIDWALGAGSEAAGPAAVAEFRSRSADSTDASAKAKRLYLKGCEEQAAGDHKEAVQTFASVLELESEFLEPYVRLARSLRALARSTEAEQILRTALALPTRANRDGWVLWTSTSFVDLGRSGSEVLETLPADSNGGFGADLRWLLERLTAGESVRINCGGGRLVDIDGTEWGGDRFWVDGRVWAWRPDDRRASEQPESIDSSWRWIFSRSSEVDKPAYEIPLPNGRYDVRLRFAPEPSFFRRRPDEPDVERFDAAIEGRVTAITANRSGAEIDVIDGFLTLRVPVEREAPKISAIEIVRLPVAP